MNSIDIDMAVRRWADHPVLGPAALTVRSLSDGADRCSDGWCYWPKPARAAAKLMELIERDGTWKYCQGDRPDATEAELRKAYAPIKAFRTRHPACKFRIFGPGGDPVVEL
jgi:hypothetical protein